MRVRVNLSDEKPDGLAVADFLDRGEALELRMTVVQLAGAARVLMGITERLAPRSGCVHGLDA
ncbi:MAG: hypothetical protein AAF714_04860, partial [Pseudomonadota bacterium]